MKKRNRRLWLFAAAAFAAAAAREPSARALEYVPVYNATLMGGQYFFKSERASLNGNANVLAAPVFKTSERWAFVPMWNSSFQGTKGVGDSVGAGSLFQQQMDHRISFMAINTPEGSLWKSKPSVSYKREFLKETRDESWGHGLFDYEKIGAGFEAEKVYKEPFSYRLGFDFYRIRFPNYQSLESKSGVDPLGNPLGRELSDRNVLDTYNFQVSASGSRPYPYEDPKISLSAGYSLLWQEFADQHLVNLAGQLTHRGRRDFLQTLSGSLGYPRPLRLGGRECRLDSSFGVNLAYNGSNQNTYDASRTQFVSDSYSYYSFGLGPAFSLNWGEKKNPASVGLSARYTRTQYLGRLVQNGDGVYGANHQYQDRYVVSAAYAYPIAPGFKLKFQTNFLWARSNQAYEKTYAYNYRTANYMMGFTWEY